MMSEEEWAQYYWALLIIKNVRDKWFDAVGHTAEEGKVNWELADKYRGFHLEESGEYMRAWDDGVVARQAGDEAKVIQSHVDILDGIGDMDWTGWGVGRKLGYNMAKVYLAIAMSNFSKLDENGKVIKNDEGKVMKGPNYFVPPIREIVDETLGL